MTRALTLSLSTLTVLAAGGRAFAQESKPTTEERLQALEARFQDKPKADDADGVGDEKGEV